MYRWFELEMCFCVYIHEKPSQRIIDSKAELFFDPQIRNVTPQNSKFIY